MLIILGGLPGAGKTTIARELARRIAAVHIRIDSIEQAILSSGLLSWPMNDAGYRVGYALAEDNLRVGRTVIADSVNPLAVTRDTWRGVADRVKVKSIEIEITCSDPAEHRLRVETRETDIAGPPLDWQDVVAREYESWRRARLVIDTAGHSVEQCLRLIERALAEVNRQT